MPRILLIEDEHDVRLMIEHVLITGGYDFDAVAGLDDSLDLLESQPYDLVIADARLPDGTGMAVLDRAAEKGIRGFIVSLR